MSIIQLSTKIRGRFGRIYARIEKSAYASGILRPTHLNLPDFLGIGAQKAGSAWLYQNLRNHPDLYLPDRKELHYFDRKFHKSLAYYSHMFRTGCDKITGEITPAYSILPSQKIRFIHSILPNIKLIFIMRNPVARAWSQALMNLVESPNREFDEIDDSEWYAHFRAKRSTLRGDYITILENWHSVFSHQQLYIGFYDSIKNDPQNLLKSIFEFLHVSVEVDWSSFPYKKVIEESIRIPIPQEYKSFLEEFYQDDIEELGRMFGSPVESWRSSKSIA